MTPEELAALHGSCFTIPRPWGAGEFRALLAMPETFLLARRNGFLLGRVIADEAELLTLAIAPQARRMGYGRALALGFAETARSRGASHFFLEVSATNIAAQALYRDLGWVVAGRRRGYYGAGIDALVMTITA